MGRHRGMGIGIALAFTAVIATGCTSQASGGGDPTSTQVAALTGTATISGTVSGPGGHLTGVKVSLNGNLQSATFTDANGQYAFSGLALGGNFSVSASATGCAFSGSQNFNNLQSNQTANFAGSGGSCTGTPVIEGPQGPPGPQGAQGPAGPTGATGATGPAGPAGPAGAQGLAGPGGPQGPMGLPGAMGPAGTPGSVGATGATGAAGPSGATGATGPAGPAGPAGAQGPAGPQGPPGATSEGFGTSTGGAAPGDGATCTLGQVLLSASNVTVGGLPADGRFLAINQNIALFALLGTTYGGDGVTTFELPDLRSVTPNNMTYSICDQGIFPSRR
ncbi:MAG TPA: tail fiber protein [Polyangia bacterium]